MDKDVDELARKPHASLTLVALGIVFGDIGTSPLYALRECFVGPHALVLNEANIMGVLSLIAWSLILVITLKYLVFVMRADNKGEGGVLALMALAQRQIKTKPKASRTLILIGLFGAALLYGDGMITPAISVLGAVEGLAIAAPIFSHYTVLIAVIILFLLFLPQHKGTGGIGAVFGPILLLWFITIAALGLYSIMQLPSVLKALNPSYCIEFLLRNRFSGVMTLGAIFLVVTGGEALYADMGHFGKTPIRIGWFSIVLPALLLNYFGQGALLLLNPEAILNPFYKLAPSWGIYPLVLIATLAAVIASQALISGAFSLTRQAVQLGYLPRVGIKHTSHEQIGQIYSPFINYLLLVSTVFLVLFFKSSSSLASAYGIAVTLTMVITTILMFFVTYYLWQWKLIICIFVTAGLLCIDCAFLLANLAKILDGGWFPLVVGFSVLLLMTTWRTGRKILAARMRSRSIPVEKYLKHIEKREIVKVPGTAIYMSSTLDLTPFALVNNVSRNKIMHENILLVNIQTEEIPVVEQNQRVELLEIHPGFFQVTFKYGFMEEPDISKALKKVYAVYPKIDSKDVTFFIGRETLVATDRPGMALWREELFAVMSRNAQRATAYFNIPSKEVIEIGTEVEL